MDNTNNKWDKRFLKIALEICSWSKDPSTKVGAVITTPEGEIISTGYNGLPRGCIDPGVYPAYDYKNERPLKYMLYEHGERNSIYNAAKRGIKLDGCAIYVTSIPKKFPCCCDCARAIIQSGIKRVVQITLDETPAQWKDSCDVTVQMFKEANIQFDTYSIDE